MKLIDAVVLRPPELVKAAKDWIQGGRKC